MLIIAYLPPQWYSNYFSFMFEWWTNNLLAMLSLSTLRSTYINVYLTFIYRTSENENVMHYRLYMYKYNSNNILIFLFSFASAFAWVNNSCPIKRFHPFNAWQRLFSNYLSLFAIQLYEIVTFTEIIPFYSCWLAWISKQIDHFASVYTIHTTRDWCFCRKSINSNRRLINKNEFKSRCELLRFQSNIVWTLVYVRTSIRIYILPFVNHSAFIEHLYLQLMFESMPIYTLNDIVIGLHEKWYVAVPMYSSCWIVTQFISKNDRPNVKRKYQEIYT